MSKILTGESSKSQQNRRMAKMLTGESRKSQQEWHMAKMLTGSHENSPPHDERTGIRIR